MNKKEIIQLLNEIIEGVSGKRKHLEETIEGIHAKGKKDHKECKYPLCSEDHTDHELLKSYQSSLDHVEGQLYEANYILGEITRKHE